MNRDQLDEEMEFLHEHELPRKRRKAYDDINESDGGGEQDE